MSKITTPEFRLSFPNVFTPRGFEGQEPKYSITMLFDKDADISALKKAAQNAVENKWPDPKKRPKNLHNPFRDGDEEKPGVQGYENTIFVKASSKMRPGVVDRKCQVVLDEEELYAGCYARATIVAFAYDKVQKGVSFALNNIQKLREGEPFSGRAKAEDDFAPVDDSDSMFS